MHDSILSGFLIISSGIVLAMAILSAFVYLQEKDKRVLHMLELWCSYMLIFFSAYLTNSASPFIVALATLVWPWRVRAIRLILEDISNLNLKRTWHGWTMGLGILVGLILGYYDWPFEVFASVISFSISIVGFDLLFMALREMRKRKINVVYYAFLTCVFLSNLHIMDYPFFRYNEFAVTGFAFTLFNTLLIAIILPTVLMMEQAKDHAQHLEGIVEKRTQQLINQSKFSALGEMAAGVAHEINNPLAVISGKAGQLRRLIKAEKADLAKLESGLESIENTAFRISKIIRGLRDFSRNSEHFPMQQSSLETIINETLDLCRERFTHNGVDLKINQCPAFTLNCRSIQLSQVLLNLLNNAFDAVMEVEKKWVELDVEETPNYVIIRVLDSGRGIPDEIKSKIMMPFFTTKEVGKGTGIGLSISKGIVEDHGGKFYLDTLSPFTCFVMEIPKLSA